MSKIEAWNANHHHGTKRRPTSPFTHPHRHTDTDTRVWSYQHDTVAWKSSHGCWDQKCETQPWHCSHQRRWAMPLLAHPLPNKSKQRQAQRTYASQGEAIGVFLLPPFPLHPSKHTPSHAHHPPGLNDASSKRTCLCTMLEFLHIVYQKRPRVSCRPITIKAPSKHG